MWCHLKFFLRWAQLACKSTDDTKKHSCHTHKTSCKIEDSPFQQFTPSKITHPQAIHIILFSEIQENEWKFPILVFFFLLLTKQLDRSDFVSKQKETLGHRESWTKWVGEEENVTWILMNGSWNISRNWTKFDVPQRSKDFCSHFSHKRERERRKRIKIRLEETFVKTFSRYSQVGRRLLKERGGRAWNLWQLYRQKAINTRREVIGLLLPFWGVCWPI